MQQTQSIALSGVMAANVGHRIETNNAIANNAVVWAKANSGAELDVAEAVLIDRLMDNVSVERVSLWLHYRGSNSFTGAEFSLDTWVNNMRARVEKLGKARKGN